MTTKVTNSSMERACSYFGLPEFPDFDLPDLPDFDFPDFSLSSSSPLQDFDLPDFPDFDLPDFDFPDLQSSSHYHHSQNGIAQASVQAAEPALARAE